jgi:CRP-like cAMP-binding protein
MEKYYPVIEKAPLFRDVAPEDIPSLIKCLAPAAKKFLKQEMVVSAGQPASKIGLMLSGSAQVVDEDVYGNRSILTDLGPHDLFGEAFCFAGTGTSPSPSLRYPTVKQCFSTAEKSFRPAPRPAFSINAWLRT